MRFSPVLLSLASLAGCTDQTLGVRKEAPTVQIISHADGDIVDEGALTPFRAQGADADGNANDLMATWYAGSRELCALAPAVPDGLTSCDTALAPEETTVTVVVADAQGNTGNDHVDLAVQASGAPNATIVAPTADGIYYSDRLVSFLGTVSDGEDAAADLAVTWESSIQGALDLGSIVSTDGNVTGSGYLISGEHYVTLLVTDTSGKTDTAGVVVQVGPPNSPPTCGITEPADGASGAEGSSVTFRGLVGDADVPADRLAVDWTSNWDGAIASSTPSTSGDVALTTSRLSPGTHTITMTATDELGESCTDFILYTVSTAPSLTILNPGDGDIFEEGVAIAFDADVFDYEDAATDLSLEWSSNIDGVFSTIGADSAGSAIFTDDTLSVGLHTLTVRVTDTTGLWVQDSVTFEVNGAPSAPGVVLTPDPAATTDDLVASITTPSIDPDGDTVTYDYAWWRNGVASTASTSAVMPASETSRGDTWRVVVTPNDGSAIGPSGEDTLTIANSTPSIATVSISPDPAGSDDTLTCAWSGFSDADGDADQSTVVWTIGGTVVGTDTTLAGAFSLGDTVTCTVTPNDGSVTGTAVSDLVVITNAPPSVDLLTLTPAAPDTNDTLTAAITTSDADGDTVSVTYAWTVNGTAVGVTTNTLSGVTRFDKHDVVSVTVTPWDGTTYGTAVTTSVTVVNSDPSAPAVSISPAAPHNANDVVCEISTPSADIDADTITYTITWTVDGVAFTGASTTTYTGDTVLAADTSPGEVWECTVVADDGEVSAAAVVASATISTSSCESPGLLGTYGTSWSHLATAPNAIPSLMTFQPEDWDTIWDAYGTNLSYYTPATDTWRTVSSTTPCNRYWNSMAPYDGDLWMIACGNVYNYDVATDVWTTMASYSGGDDANQTVADCDGNIYGHASDGHVVIYNVDTDTVSYVADGLGSETETRMAYDPTVDAVFYGDFTLGYIHRLDATTHAVTTMSAVNPEGWLNDIFCGDWSGHIYAAGGTSGTSLWQYDIAANTWSTITSFPIDHGNNGSCTVSPDGYLYMADAGTTTFYRLPLY